MASGPTLDSFRDIFLSHRSTNKDFVRRLAADIESALFNGHLLRTWVDEAEIGPGQSVTGMINDGLENSRFIGFVLSPYYFESASGWTDAEWHAAVYSDPDNRRSRLLPLLAADCPYIPALLRHLKCIDLRAHHYTQGLKELLTVLRNEPVPRPTVYHGQLITTDQKIARSTLVAERAVPQSFPDLVSERLYCNLLPIEHLPSYVYSAPIANSLIKTRKDRSTALPSKEAIKAAIRSAQADNPEQARFMPAFRLFEDRLFTFHDLESPDNPLAPVIEDGEVEPLNSKDFIAEEENRKLLTSLLNMALTRHVGRLGLVIDDTKHDRFFFSEDNGGPRVIRWAPLKRMVSRTVAKPMMNGERVLFWRHLGAYLKITFLANKFYVQIAPTWVITSDGQHASGGPDIGRRVIKWTGPERNLHLLYHVRFWTSVLRNRPGGPIFVRAGDQSIEISSFPAFIQQSYGIGGDRRDLLRILDRTASSIEQDEEEKVDEAVTVGLAALDHAAGQNDEDEDDGIVLDDDEEDKAE